MPFPPAYTDPPDYDPDLGQFQNVGAATYWGFETLFRIGYDAFDTANTALEALADIELPDAPEASLPDFPDDPTIDLTLETVPTAPTITEPTLGALPTAPEFEGELPELNYPAQPDAFDGDVPASPDIDYDVALPDAPDIEVPEFDGIAPVAPSTSPALSFDFEETAYARTIDVAPQINAMLAGTTGLPAPIEQALFDRGRAREDITAKKLVEEAFEDWSSRGFSQPGGELARRVEAARQANQNAANAVNREITIQLHKERLEMLRFGVEQGLAYEGQLIDLYQQMAVRRLQAAELTSRLALEYFNAEVALFNAEIAAFNAQAELYRTNLQGSQQRVEIYKATIDGARAQVDVKRARIEAYRSEVEAFAATVAAKRAEYEAWGEAVKGEGQKADVYKTTVQAFSERVNAYKTATDAVLAPAQIKIDSERLKIQAFDSAVTGVRAKLEAKSQLNRAIVDNHGSLVQAALSEANVSIENAKMVSEHLSRNVNILLESSRAIAQISSQLSAGTLSAIHVSTSMGTSGSFQNSSSVGVSYSVDGGEGTAPTLPY